MARQQGAYSRSKSPLWLFGAVGAFFWTLWKTVWPFIKLGSIGGSLFSMLVSIGAYVLIAPLHLSVGFVLLVLIHELGHVWAARLKGLPTSAPVFIPLIGAIVNMKRHPRDAATEAFIALGGPLLGTVGAVFFYVLGHHSESPLLLVLAYIGFLLNLVNLLPVSPFDGGKIILAVSRKLWVAGLFVGLGCIVYFEQYLLLTVWLLFAWDLYRRHLFRRNKEENFSTWAGFEVPAENLLGAEGIESGPAHRFDLPFTTYSSLDGRQKVELFWEEIGLRGQVPLPWPSIIVRVRTYRIDRRIRNGRRVLHVKCQIDYRLHENDAYYNTPVSARWRIGIVYALLAAFLTFMLYRTAGAGMSVMP